MEVYLMFVFFVTKFPSLICMIVWKFIVLLGGFSVRASLG